MSVAAWLNVAVGLAFPPAVSFIWYRVLCGSMAAFFVGWLCGAVAFTLAALVQRDAPGGAASAVSAAVCLIAWWWKRRQRGRGALGWLGYKARSALARLLQRARRAAQPRPHLRPIPQGGVR